MRHIFFSFILLLVLNSCMTNCSNNQSSSSTDSKDITYSQLMKVKNSDNFTSVEIVNPWKKETILQRYILVPREDELPNNLPEGTLIRTPIKNIVIYSSIHAKILKEFGALDKIIGVCEPQYMTEPYIIEGVKNGSITNLGQASNPSVEKIIDIETEIIIASPFENSSYGAVARVGIPIIEAADYLEQSPLARAEWIKLYGLLFGKESIADSIFNETEKNYLALTALCDTIPDNEKPTLITDKLYGSSWDISPSGSYAAKMYQDAGAAYIFKDLPGTKNIPMSFESVFDKAIDADIWIIKYYSYDGNLSYDLLSSDYKPYSNFKAFKNQTIFGCNTSPALHRPNYYDDIALHPDLILKDLIKVFHPDLLPDYELRYFLRLEN